jgi:hypothetical protein
LWQPRQINPGLDPETTGEIVMKNLNREADKAVDTFAAGQQQAEQAGSPGAIGTVQADYEADRKVGRDRVDEARRNQPKGTGGNQ